MSKTVLTGILFLLCFHAFSQNLKVYNQSTRKPVEDVFVYHEDQAVTGSTLQNGSLDISKFPKTGNFVFQHPGFLQKSVSYEKLSQESFTVYLKERILEIDEVVVSANRWEQNKEDISQEILTLDKKQVKFHNPPTSADLLSNSGQVFVQKSQLGGGSPMLRGFSANSVLLVVDGVRLNNAIYRSGNLQNVINIDPNALSGAEVIYGPGSVMYGSDAMGGVMDFHVIDPDFSLLKNTQYEGNIFGRYSSAANEQTGHIDFSVSGQKSTYFGSITYTSLGDLRAGSNRSKGYKGHFKRENYVKSSGSADFLVSNKNENIQKNSGYNLFNTIHKLKVKSGENSEVSYGFYYSTTSDIPRYDRLTEQVDGSDSLIYAEWFYGPQTWMMHSVNFTTYKPTFFYNKAKATLSYQKYRESRNDRKFGNEYLRNLSEDVDLYTLNIDFDKEMDKSSFFYGVDMFYNDVESSAFSENLLTGEKTSTIPRYPDGGSQYYTTAIYGNYVWHINTQWTLNFGSRFNDVHLKARTDDQNAFMLAQDNLSISNQNLNGMSGAVFKPSNKTRWNLLVSSGFRAPNIDDIGKIFEVDNEVMVVPNPGLKPEYSYNQELGLQQKIGVLNLDIVAFHSYLTNAIVRGLYEIDGKSTMEVNGETKEIRAQVNADKARIYGSSLRLSAQFNPSWATLGTITYTEGYQIETNEPLRHVPPTFGRLGLIYKEKMVKAELYSEYNFTKSRSDIPSSEIDDKPHLYTDTGTPGWATLNLMTEYIFSEYMTLQLGIENIFDTHYRPYASGISAPGRNIIFSLRGSLH